MNQDDGYQDITDFESVLQYIENMDGFRNFPIGTVQYDGATLSLGIEEIVKGQSWPSDASGRVWFLSFSQISNITLDIDVAMRLWIKEMYIEEDNTFVIECGEGSVAVLANSIELAIPVEEDTMNNAPSLADLASKSPLNVKNIINDIKNVVIHNQPTQITDPTMSANLEEASAAQPSPPASRSATMASTSVQTIPAASAPVSPIITPAPTQSPPAIPVSNQNSVQAPSDMSVVQPPNINADIALTATSAPAPATPQSTDPFLNNPNFVSPQPIAPASPPPTPKSPTITSF